MEGSSPRRRRVAQFLYASPRLSSSHAAARRYLSGTADADAAAAAAQDAALWRAGGFGGGEAGASLGFGLAGSSALAASSAAALASATPKSQQQEQRKRHRSSALERLSVGNYNGAVQSALRSVRALGPDGSVPSKDTLPGTLLPHLSSLSLIRGPWACLLLLWRLAFGVWRSAFALAFAWLS